MDKLLPNEWLETQLEQITSDISYGYTAKSSSEKIGPHMLRITDIQDNQVIWSNVPFCEISATQKEKYNLLDGDLVFARTGATVGKSFLIQGTIPESVYASYLIRVRCQHDVKIEYLSYFFKSQAYWTQITEFSSGIGQPNVNGTKLKSLTVPFPPLAEQQQIAAKLDELLAQVDSIKTRLDAIPKIMKRFRQSVLAAAVSGKLTEDWRLCNPQNSFDVSQLSEEKVKKELFEQAKITLPNLPDSWQIVPASKLIKYITSGSRGWSNYYSNSGSLFLRMSNVRYNTTKLDLNDLQYVSLPENVEGKRSLVQIEDLLISITADVGRVARIDRNLGEAYVNQHLALVRPIDSINSEYLATCIASLNVGVTQIEKLKRGATKSGLGLDDIRNLAIPLPPIEEQTEIVRRVEQLFAYADQIEQRVKDAQNRVNNLSQATLAKAFRGELTADWRAQNPHLISGENSASALLAKIQSERNANKSSKKPK